MKLTQKQEMFCLEYLKDLNATQASIRAGYSEKTAKEIGYENLSKPHIAERIQKLMFERTSEAKLDALYVLNRLHEIDKLDVLDILDDSGNMKAIRDWPKSWRTSISGLDIQDMMQADTASVIQKIKWPDKLRNIELLGKHVNIKAWDREEEKPAPTDIVINFTDAIKPE